MSHPEFSSRMWGLMVVAALMTGCGKSEDASAPSTQGSITDTGVTAEEILIGSANDLSGPIACLLYTSPSPRDQRGSRMPSSA